MCTGRLFGHERRKRNTHVNVVQPDQQKIDGPGYMSANTATSATSVVSELHKSEVFDMTITPIAYISSTPVNAELGTPLAQSHCSIFEDLSKISPH
ncbi:hypothetical protein AWZ03_009479 [Drosophila navojoa]|uniref:Uncharacterized protein n=1 Tax=Drosophila navojoa TaxID=7232 RepID=A0A484B634_DRONA|nr:hypothetical protein AWZ03_009479 [Drosophila navojoa]